MQNVNTKYNLKLAHLYPEEMNLYGDYGNIICLKKRCEWRGINLEVVNIGIGDELDESEYDILFLGGGMDADQLDIFNDLVKNKKKEIEKAVENYKVFLLICGGYQLFGKYFLTVGKERIEGLGILDIETVGGDVRCIGNIVTNTMINGKDYKLIGFENHSGQTILSNTKEALGQVIKGYGNNTKDNTEGIRYKNVFGTYMHGSFLPKNPMMADEIISLAIGNKYSIKLSDFSLNDSLEEETRQSVLSIL